MSWRMAACPFCGSLDSEVQGYAEVYVHCHSCGADGPPVGARQHGRDWARGHAVGRWNDRAPVREESNLDPDWERK